MFFKNHLIFVAPPGEPLAAAAEYGCVLWICLLAVQEDFQTWRISNQLLKRAAKMFLFCRLAAGVLPGKYEAPPSAFPAVQTAFGVPWGCSLALLMAALWMLYRIGALGAGDCKLLLLLGVWGTPERGFLLLFDALLWGAAWGVVLKLRQAQMRMRRRKGKSAAGEQGRDGEHAGGITGGRCGAKNIRKTGIRFALPILLAVIESGVQGIRF